AAPERMASHAAPRFLTPRSRCRFDRHTPCKLLLGEVAERSKALDWNSSNISTGGRGFESHPPRQMVISSRAWCSRGQEGFSSVAPSERVGDDRNPAVGPERSEG